MPIVFQSFFSCFTRTHEQTEKWRSTAYSANNSHAPQWGTSFHELSASSDRMKNAVVLIVHCLFYKQFVMNPLNVCASAPCSSCQFIEKAARSAHIHACIKNQPFHLGVCVRACDIYSLSHPHTATHRSTVSLCARFVSFRLILVWRFESLSVYRKFDRIALPNSELICVRTLVNSISLSCSVSHLICYRTHNTQYRCLADWLTGWLADSTRLVWLRDFDSEFSEYTRLGTSVRRTCTNYYTVCTCSSKSIFNNKHSKQNWT